MPSVQDPQQPAPPAPQPPPPGPGPAPAPAPAPREALSEYLSTLSDAMRQLAESQKSLAETVKKGSATDPAPAAPTPIPATDIGGDPGGGARPGAVVDYSRLSPLQQITLGLRGAGTKGVSAGAD